MESGNRLHWQFLLPVAVPGYPGTGISGVRLVLLAMALGCSAMALGCCAMALGCCATALACSVVSPLVLLLRHASSAALWAAARHSDEVP
eukprot:3550227-Rhodomonas_salina.3